MVKVPGSQSSLEREKAQGADIRVVYSPLDAFRIAQENPNRPVIFLAVGFETTAPTVAATLLEAHRKQQKNFFILSAHKLIPPAMEALVLNPEIRLQGFLCPGHVSTIIGAQPYEFLARDYGMACVIAGFEALDMLEGILLLIRQIVKGTPKVEIQYRRVVRREGNPRARRLLEMVFEPQDTSWRGLGSIARSGLKVRKEFQSMDAEAQFPVQIPTPVEPKGCICGLILQGIRTPLECPLFGRTCTPESPVGACMVSSEGTCAAYYKYGDYQPL